MCFAREFEFGVFMMGKRLRIACFLHRVFLLSMYFRHFWKKNRATSPLRVSNLPFQRDQCGSSHLSSKVLTDFTTTEIDRKVKLRLLQTTAHPLILTGSSVMPSLTSPLLNSVNNYSNPLRELKLSNHEQE